MAVALDAAAIGIRCGASDSGTAPSRRRGPHRVSIVAGQRHRALAGDVLQLSNSGTIERCFAPAASDDPRIGPGWQPRGTDRDKKVVERLRRIERDPEARSCHRREVEVEVVDTGHDYAIPRIGASG